MYSLILSKIFFVMIYTSKMLDSKFPQISLISNITLLIFILLHELNRLWKAYNVSLFNFFYSFTSVNSVIVCDIY